VEQVLRALTSPCQLAEARQEYEQQVAEFRRRTRGLGWEGLEHYYWYHTIDLGKGLVTPGDHDFREMLPSFGFPENMAGMRVLDVGSATGFFAFEFERRGAEVISVELPSLADWDIISSERERINVEMMAWLNANTPQESYRRHLDGPFQFCRSALGSRVSRCYSSVYDLSAAKLGQGKFDLIYAGDLLLHLFSPFKALDVLSRLCNGSLVATVDANFPGPTDRPLMAFLGCHSEEVDRRTWWAVNATCVKDMLKRLGFQSAWVSGQYSGIVRRAWFPFCRDVVWASKTGKAPAETGV
jgi:tRNA (mo5U34)-methyltransferase